MKKSNKLILLLTLVVMLVVTIVIPAKSFAKTEEMPGRWGTGPFGLTCWCPEVTEVECGCIIFHPEG